MKADTWMAFYVGDYVTDTMHLTTRQHGAYLLLIIAAWKGGGWVTGSDTALMAITKLSLKEWQQDGPALLPFFVKDGDKLRHNRVAFEWNEAQRRTADKSRAGRAGASKRWHGVANGSAIAEPMPEQSQVDAHSQSHIQKNSVAKATGAPAPQFDPVKALFDDGVKLLTDTGTNEKQARSLVGKWRRDHGDEATREAIQAAYDCGITQPCEWIPKRLGVAGKPRISWNDERIRAGMEVLRQ